MHIPKFLTPLLKDTLLTQKGSSILKFCMCCFFERAHHICAINPKTPQPVSGKRTHDRRRRRCGPPVGRPRGTSPWCPPAPHGLESDREGGFTPTRPAKHHGGGSPLRLLPLSPGPRYVHAPALHVAGSPPRGTEWGARRSAGSTSGTVHHPPKGRGTQSHGCGPLAARYYRLGGVWPADHGGLVRGPVPPPPPAHGTSAEGVRARGHPLTLRSCPPNPQCRTSAEGTRKPPPR